MCYRRPLQQGKQAAESRSVAVDAGVFRRTGKERMNLGSPVTRHACTGGEDSRSAGSQRRGPQKVV